MLVQKRSSTHTVCSTHDDNRIILSTCADSENDDAFMRLHAKDGSKDT